MPVSYSGGNKPIDYDFIADQSTGSKVFGGGGKKGGSGGPLVGADPVLRRLDPISQFGDPDRTTGDYRGDADASLEARIAAINAQYGGGGGDGGAAAAVQQALAYLNDVKGNRGAIAGAYDEFIDITSPYGQAAAESALQVKENSEEYFEQQGVDREEFIKAQYEGAEDIIAEYAELIGAGKTAEVAAKAEVDGEQLALEQSEAETSQIMAMIELEEIVLNRQALADTAQSEGRNDRRAEVMDAQFAEQQKAAEERLAAARRAAAAAAAARRASMAARNAAIAEAREEGRYDEVTAGQYSALSYLNKNGRGLAGDRAEFLKAKAFNAIENFIPPSYGEIGGYFQGQGLSSDEIKLITGTVDAYYDGRDNELRQQGSDPSAQYKFSEG